MRIIFINLQGGHKKIQKKMQREDWREGRLLRESLELCESPSQPLWDQNGACTRPLECRKSSPSEAGHDGLGISLAWEISSSRECGWCRFAGGCTDRIGAVLSLAWVFSVGQMWNNWPRVILHFPWDDSLKVDGTPAERADRWREAAGIQGGGPTDTQRKTVHLLGLGCQTVHEGAQ